MPSGVSTHTASGAGCLWVDIRPTALARHRQAAAACCWPFAVGRWSSAPASVGQIRGRPCAGNRFLPTIRHVLHRPACHEQRRPCISATDHDGDPLVIGADISFEPHLPRPVVKRLGVSVFNQPIHPCARLVVVDPKHALDLAHAERMESILAAHFP